MRLSLAAATLLLLSGCTKCSEEKQPHMDPAAENLKVYTSDSEEDPIDEEELNRQIEKTRASKAFERREPVKMDIPGPQRPDEDRD